MADPVVPGNLPEDIRYKVSNEDGSVSTVRTMSFGTDQGEVLIPTVVDNKVVSDEEAIQHYYKTGQHFGIFRNIRDANWYANDLHRRHEMQLNNPNNNDIVDNPDTYVPQKGDVVSTDVPASSAPAAPEVMFAEDPPQDSGMFDEGPEGLQTTIVNPPAEKRPLARSVLALALEKYGTPSAMMLGKENMSLAEQIIDQQQEQMTRMDIAFQRTQDKALLLRKLKEQTYDDNGSPLTKEATDLVDQAYTSAVREKAEDNAHVAAEQQALERIQSAKEEGDYVEAWIARDLYTNGHAEQRVFDQMTRDLVTAQFIERQQAKYEDSGWVRGFVNGVLRLIPLKDNFDVSGIVEDAGINVQGSFVDFLLRGENYATQREAVMGLPLQQYAQALAPGGALEKSIEANAGFLLDDPTMAHEMSQKLLKGQNKEDRTTENIWSGIDVVSSLPIFTGTKLLTSMGARSAAVDNVVRAITTGDAVAARALTGETAEELAGHMMPSAIVPKGAKETSLGTDVTTAIAVGKDLQKIMPEIAASNKFTSADQVLAAVDVHTKELQKVYGKAIKDFTVLEEDVKTGVKYKWSGELAEDGQKVHLVRIRAGKKDGKGAFADEQTARNRAAQNFGWDKDSITAVETPEGWYAEFDVNLPTEGFVTAPMHGSTHSLFSFWRGADAIADKQGVAKALVGENGAALFAHHATKAIKRVLKGVSRKDKAILDEILKKGNVEAKWYSSEELGMLYERASGGKAIPKKITQGYDAYRKLSDYAWWLRNKTVYQHKAEKGYMSLRFEMGDEAYDLDGIINHSPQQYPLGGLYDVSARRWIDKSYDIRSLADEGYVIVKTDQPVRIGMGETTDHILIKRNELEQRPLRQVQLNYSPGGSRAYAASNFAKQAVEDANGRLLSPKTFIAGKNKNEMCLWVEKMNLAIEHMRANPINPDMRYLERVLAEAPGAPTAEDFVDKVATHQLSVKHNIEVVGDREFPSQYFNKSDDELRFVDREETSIEAYERSMGQMYYSPKGEALKDYTGEFAETIDPWETLNKSLTEVSRVTSFSGYKQSMLERFEANYKNYLQLKNADSHSLYAYVNAEIRPGSANKALENQIRNEQAALKRILNFETKYEKMTRQAIDSMANWALGKGLAGSTREKAYDTIHWFSQKNPVSFIRGLAFDANLGFWNPGQILVQTSTMLSAMALHGDPRVMFAAFPLHGWRLSGYSDNVLDLMAKKGMWKGAFENEEEFKNFARFYRASGIDEVGADTFAQLRELGPSRVYGAGSAFDAVREKGRGLFFMAERFNRATAATIAWQLLKKKGLKQGTSQFKEEFMRLTNDYSMSMMNSSAAGFQRGFWSIPTQFWAYSFRMMEALTGKKFTGIQKARLLFANFLMAGTAGVPAGFLAEYGWEKYGKGGPTDIASWDGWVERGLFDGLAYLMTGADVRIGDKVGTADLIPNAVKDLLNMGMYGEKSTAEMVLGATGSKFGQALPVLGDALYYSATSMAGLDTGNIAEETWLKLAKELQTINFAHNAIVAHEYGMYKTKGGSVVETNLPDADAFFFALGFQPGSMDAMSYYFDGLKDDDVKDYARLISNWRQEAITNRDKLDENAKKEAALLGLLPMSERIKVRKSVYDSFDPDTYRSIKRRSEDEISKSEYYDSMGEAIEKAKLEDNGDNE